MHSSRVLLIGAIVLGVLSAAGAPDPVLLFAVFGALAFGVKALWPVSDAPVLLLAFCLQWLSVAMKPIETAITHRTLHEFSSFGADLAPAVYFSLIALLLFAGGLRVGSAGSRVDWSRTLAADGERWPEGKVIQLSLVMLIAGHILETASNYSGSARQIVLGLSGVRQSGLFILVYWCLLTQRSLAVLAAVMVVEIAFGLSGFFGGFRYTVLVFLLAASTAKPRVGWVSVIGTSIAVTLMLLLSIFWSAIKPEYRDFLNGGTGAQVAAQPMSKRAEFIRDAALHFDGVKFEFGVDALVARISYIDFLAKTIEYIPEYKPHTEGRQSIQTLIHIFTPRVLFPNKPPTPLDTTITAELTGMEMNNDPNTSISVGYIGEFYADFGYLGALACSFGMGLLGGASLRILRENFGISPIVSYALVISIILQLAVFETALIKLVGGVITALAAAVLLQRLIIPRVMPITRRGIALGKPA